MNKCVWILLVYLCSKCYSIKIWHESSIHANVVMDTPRTHKQRYIQQQRKTREGETQLSGYVVNGVDVTISTYPYMALITFNGKIHCGGSIISQYVILTAAHCLVNGTELFQKDKLKVFLGATKPMAGTKYDVCKIHPHKKFGSVLFGYDIGLILLNQAIKFGMKVQPAKLSINNRWKKRANQLTVIGFGSTETKRGVPRVLQMTQMKFVNRTTCDKSQHGLPFPMVVQPHMFCMIGERWTSDCYGDSGSPVIWKRTVVGIVSSGRDTFCGSDMMPSMYTEIPYFSLWILHNMKKLESHIHSCLN